MPYAWAPIDYGAEVDDKGNITSRKRIGLGEEVDQGKLGIEDDEWRYLQNVGIVREEKYPKDIDVNSPGMESPNTIIARKARAQLEGASQSELNVMPA